MMLYRTYQSYCDRLRQDMYFLTSNGRLSEHLVDKIILQLNRVYPQILTNKEAEKFRNPKTLLHSRLSDLIKHLQNKGDKHCQEFYRALQINAEQVYNDLPSRKIISKRHLTVEDNCPQARINEDRTNRIPYGGLSLEESAHSSSQRIGNHRFHRDRH
ncbi:PREDICTED: caspase recruitment domain-containing protein 19 isoform X3 [Crocodylus porosus]|uniref:caspase recruitment domain-containing protein 19 isoform X3 n=1 Tax=Crocodylus porosus TaxID=8502 RepID=UPI00093BE65B|nr:PREDICTED: caspase recruitment domain-containing protein 19 isoform X3 [Crocodylus porosus]